MSLMDQKKSWLAGLGVEIFASNASAVGPSLSGRADATAVATPPKNKLVEIGFSKMSDAEKQHAVRKAGYVVFDVEVIGTDWRGQPMDGISLTITFRAPGKDDGLAIGELKNGVFLKKNNWGATEGVIVVDAWDLRDNVDITMPHMPEGVATYKVADCGTLKLKLEQDYDVVDEGDSSNSDQGSSYGHQTELKGGAELDLGVGKIGDEGSETRTTQHDYKQGTGHSVSQHKRVPTNRLKVTQVERGCSDGRPPVRHH